MKRPPLRDELATEENHNLIQQDAMFAVAKVIDQFKRSRNINGLSSDNRKWAEVQMGILAGEYEAYLFNTSPETNLVASSREIKNLLGEEHGKKWVDKIYAAVNGVIDEKLGTVKTYVSAGSHLKEPLPAAIAANQEWYELHVRDKAIAKIVNLQYNYLSENGLTFSESTSFYEEWRKNKHLWDKEKIKVCEIADLFSRLAFSYEGYRFRKEDRLEVSFVEEELKEKMGEKTGVEMARRIYNIVDTNIEAALGQSRA